MKITKFLSTTALVYASFGAAGAAVAQTPTEQDDPATLQSEAEIESGVDAQSDADANANDEPIVITGSRIRRPNLESSIPITSIGGEEFFQQGQNNVGDTLNDLPQLRSTFGQSNAGRFLGTTGLNLLDLRGLGTQRTLVLVNGRRHVPADILNNAVSPDVNTIPNDLIERVDVVTGGNSAVYGSDAIAGVVNFVLRRDFKGLQVRGNVGLSEYGAGGNQYVSAMYGLNFGEGRGNITVHGEYAHQDRVFGSDIPFLRSVNAFVVVDSDPGGTPNGSDGVADRTFFRDIRSGSIFTDTLIAFAQPVGGRCGTGFNGTPFNCNFLFQPDGSLAEQTGTRVGAGQIGSFIGGNGPTGREGRLLSVFPKQDRYNVNLLAHFSISDAFEPFVEAKFVRVDTQGQQSTPAFIQGSSIDAFRERPRIDNPFLTPQQRAFITNEILTAGFRPNVSSRTALTAADRVAIANGSFRFPIQRFLLDLGVRDEKSKRETYRIVSGLRGTFNDDWAYEISGNYGKVTEDTTILGNIDTQKFLLSIDAARNPANGQIVCRSQIDPTAAIDVIENAASAARLAADVAACVPYNPFGTPNNEAARRYIVTDTVSKASLDQLVISGFVTGDTSQAFELPGGPVRFALGGEYRREKVFYRADPLVEQGFTFYNALPTFDPDAFDVKEGYAELQFPILKDTLFFEDLTLSAAGRVADYGGTVGTVLAYNAGLEWQPVQGIRFRANYGRSVRAPNVSETSFPLTQNFAPGFQDPCRALNIGSNQNRAVNCAADLGALLNGSNFANLPAYSLEILSGSNTELLEETSDSYTVGVVVQPRFIPGLSVTVDYFDITVDDVINSPTAQTIVNTCYDLPTLDNQFCALFERNRGPGAGPNDEVPGQILDTSLEVIPLNFAALVRRGLDVEIAYRRSFGANNRFDTRLIYTHQFQNSNFTNPSIPDFENRILTELGDPQDEFQWNVDLKLSAVTFGYQMRYIGKQVLNLYEDFFGLQNRPPQDADYADTRYYPDVFYHDARVNFEAGKNFNFYVGVDNLTNRKPPLGLTGVGGGSGIYNIRGRNYFAGVRARF